MRLLQDGFSTNVVSGILGNCVEGLQTWLLGTLHEHLNVYRIVGSDVYCDRKEALCCASMATLSIFIFDSHVYTSIIQRERIVMYPGNNGALFLYCLTFFFFFRKYPRRNVGVAYKRSLEAFPSNVIC